MGVALPKPVLTQIQERHGSPIFRCGSSCMNGFRDSMEDAHLVYLQENWGFFGVFDGHVNDQCSMYLEGAWREALDKEKDSMPMSDDRMKELALQIDQTWLDAKREGGSTGTFFVARKDGEKVHLQVGNVGDSRVLACIDGQCRAMTEDHKPDNAEERARIEECGGRVEANRVDGSLAVSRAFGDRDYKMGKGDQLEQKVIALADVTHADLKFNSGDFALLCCDGVFEGNFSNEEVVQVVKEHIEKDYDLCEIAGIVCQTAINRGSHDNISCVIVQFKDGSDYAKGPHTTVIPGPFSAPDSSNFRKAYELMAQKADTTPGNLLESRYDAIMKKEERTPEEDEEMRVFGNGPDASLKGEERTAYFTDIFAKLCASSTAQSDYIERIQHLQQQVGVPLPVLLSLMKETDDQM